MEPRKQKRYERVSKVKKYPNFGFTMEKEARAAVMENGAPQEYRYLHRQNESNPAPGWMIVNSKSRECIKQRRLGNSYVSSTVPQGISLIVKVNKRLKKALKDGLLMGGRLHPKRFFEDGKSYIKAEEKGRCHEDSFIRTNGNEQMKPRRREWVSVGLSTNP